MALTLTVISRQSQSLGVSAVKVFEAQGGTIGRAAGNDWVLPDQSKFVSSHHATIEVVGGDYYLCDLSTNGTFVNGSVEAIGYGSKVRLNQGDRIQIGEYELAVAVAADRPGYQPPGGPSPFDAAPSPFASAPASPFRQSAASPFGQGAASPFPPPPAPAAPEYPTGQAWPQTSPPMNSSSQFGSAPSWDPDGPAGSLGPQDPLELMSNRGARGQAGIGDFDDAVPYQAAPPPGQGAWQDSAPMEEHFAVPAAAPDLDPIPGQIPADWDKTTFPRQQEAASSPSVMPGSSQAYRGSELPSDWQSEPPAAAAPPWPPTSMGAPVAAAPAPTIGPQARVAPGPVPAASRSPPPVAQQVRTGAADAGVLQRILEAAGMDPQTAQIAAANPDLPDTLGVILQIFVQGIMDVLRARSEVKDTFKLQQTVMRPVENNPLKFFPNGHEALGAMLTRHGSGYLPPVEAAQQAFDDTKAHQLAMMAGMQAAFESLMARFDPQVLQGQVDEGGQGGLFKGRNKAKYWDGLVELYAKQMRNPDESFRRLFGEPFAEAYEEQMRRLTSVRRRH